MTPEELYMLWAPTQSIWSQWVIPVPFAQLQCAEASALEDKGMSTLIPESFAAEQGLAIVVDLPGAESIETGLAAMQRGFRPVPVLDGSAGPDNFQLTGTLFPNLVETKIESRAAVDMRGLLLALCAGSSRLKEMQLAPEAQPAFLLDSNRMGGRRIPNENVFDNRWKVFPQDFPSAHLLQNKGIHRVVLIQSFVGQPQDDLAHVLLRWQEAGMEIFATKHGEMEKMELLQIARPSWYRTIWYRALAIIGLSPASRGGFGNWPVEKSSG